MKSISKLLIVPFLILFGCDKNNDSSNDEVLNKAPQIFIVTVENVTDQEATVIWTMAKDPENENVSYDVFLNGILLKESIATFTYSLEDLLANTSYNGKIVASDELNETTVDFSFDTIEFIPLIFQGDVILSTQSEVLDFGNNEYNEIEGDFTIDDGIGNTVNDIVDLTPLLGITKVSGNLNLFNTGLRKLDGLNNLLSVGDSLSIVRNDILENLDAFENLESVGSLRINGFSLDNMKGLNKITIINNLLISGNLKMKSLEGLDNLTMVSGTIDISTNTELVDITQLSQISGPIQNLGIRSNPLLSSLEGLHNITSISNFFGVSGNSSLEDMDGLRNITFAGVGEMNIRFNSSLTNLDGLSKLDSIGGDLYIYDCDSLLNLDGLRNIRSVGGFFWLFENLSLENIEGLENLETINGAFYISRNAELVNLRGLNKLNSMKGNLQIDENENLSDFCGIQNLLSGGGFPEAAFYFANNNAFDPSKQDIIEGNCSN